MLIVTIYLLQVHCEFGIDVHFAVFFPSMIFCGEAAKKASIDGLKWRDLVVGVGG